MSVLAARSDPPEDPPDLLALPPGARILEFEIERVVGRGGFSIVYLAFDHSLHRRVALKEYLPDTLARRDATLTVVPFSAKHRETFDAGLRSFLQEARLLARFDHPSLVKVYRFWEASGTAYMAMSYYEGATLRESFRHGTRPEPKMVESLAGKLLDAVELLHRAECLHRDIAPDNVILQRNGNPVLLDFGAARRIIREKTQALTVILKTGFAPIEQYSEEGEMAQGPWTDVYALAATFYAVMTGKGPPASVSRAYKDPYVPLAQAAPPGYAPQFTTAIDQALSFLPQDRPQTIAAFRDALGLPDRRSAAASNETTVRMPRRSASTPKPAEPEAPTVLVPRPAPRRRGMPKAASLALAGAAVVAVAVAIAVLYGTFDVEQLPATEARVATREAAPAPPSPASAPSLPPAAPAPASPPPARPPPAPVQRTPTAAVASQPKPAPAPAPASKGNETSVATAEPPPRQPPPEVRVPEPNRRAPSLIPVPAPSPLPAAPPPVVAPSEPPTVVAKADPGPRLSGSAWERGRDLEQVDAAEAVKWFRRGAEEGDARAQNSLGFAYQSGRGVGVDYAAARKWYEAAALQGNAAAQNNLGNLHAAGLGVARNPVAAAEWYRKSADHGYPQAQNNLGLMLETGRGVFQNPAAAAELFRSAAERGNMNAMYNLGRLYEAGNGVPKSQSDAQKWFQAAADKGQKNAAARLADLEARR